MLTLPRARSWPSAIISEPTHLDLSFFDDRNHIIVPQPFLNKCPSCDEFQVYSETLSSDRRSIFYALSPAKLLSTLYRRPKCNHRYFLGPSNPIDDTTSMSLINEEGALF